MSKSYQQLTEEERIEIYALKREEKSVVQIANALKRNPTTVYREIKRNSGLRNYRPKQAHTKAMERRASKHKATKMTEPTMAYIGEKLALEWSPEHVQGMI